MPAPKHRSRTMRRVFKKTPGGKTVLHYCKRKPAKPQCGGCGKPLQGVPRKRPTEMQNMPKTAKRPDRPYGGVLCTQCTRALMIEKARQE